ncbi:hypothetical protein ABH927_004197 [Planotetraspora sp. GP83]
MYDDNDVLVLRFAKAVLIGMPAIGTFLRTRSITVF